MYKLYLDDWRSPPDDTWIVARSYDEAVKIMLEKGCPNIMSFDFHLTSKPNGKNGLDVARWIVTQDKKTGFIPSGFQFSVHSSDIARGKQILLLLTSYLEGNKS